MNALHKWPANRFARVKYYFRLRIKIEWSFFDAYDVTSSAGGLESVNETAICAHIKSWSGKVFIIRSIVMFPF